MPYKCVRVCVRACVSVCEHKWVQRTTSDLQCVKLVKAAPARIHKCYLCVVIVSTVSQWGHFRLWKCVKLNSFLGPLMTQNNCTSTEHGLNREIILSVLYSAERCKICSVIWCTATEHPRVHWGESWRLQTHQGAVQHAYYSNRLF